MLNIKQKKIIPLKKARFNKKHKKSQIQYETNLILKVEINKFNLIKKIILKVLDLAKIKNKIKFKIARVITKNSKKSH
jgi:hypothetical protein